jgi:hypothetical protein
VGLVEDLLAAFGASAGVDLEIPPREVDRELDFEA